jgi:hypothetical protein
MKTRSKLFLLGLSLSLVTASSARALDRQTVAGWDFSQFQGDGALFVDNTFQLVGTLPANYSFFDPTFGVGAESAQFGTLYFDGQFGSTASDQNDTFLPTAGSLASNLDAPGQAAFDSWALLQLEGQVFAQSLSMIAKAPLSVVFRAQRGENGALAEPGKGPDLAWSISFAGRAFSGTTNVAVEFSTDGGAYTPIETAVLTPADSAFTVTGPSVRSDVAFFRLTFDPTTPAEPILDNVIVQVSLDKVAGKCVNQLNKNYRTIFKTQAKEAEKCVADFSAGKDLTPATDVLSCIEADRKGKLAKVIAKNTDLLKGAEAKFCTCSDPAKCAIPAFSYAGNITDASENLATFPARFLQFDLFGQAPDLGIADKTVDTTVAKCQQTAQKSTNKLADRIFNEFVLCKKQITNPKGGKADKVPTAANNPAQSIQDIAACVNFDTDKAKLARERQKLADKVNKDCVASDLPAAFGAGNCASAGTPAELITCLEDAALSRVELAIREVDDF